VKDTRQNFQLGGGSEVIRLGIVRIRQFSEGLDEFYKDFRNKGIDVDLGIRYVRD
jgi:hypothetical protein